MPTDFSTPVFSVEDVLLDQHGDRYIETEDEEYYISQE